MALEILEGPATERPVGYYVTREVRHDRLRRCIRVGCDLRGWEVYIHIMALDLWRKAFAKGVLVWAWAFAVSFSSYFLSK